MSLKYCISEQERSELDRYLQELESAEKEQTIASETYSVLQTAFQKIKDLTDPFDIIKSNKDNKEEKLINGDKSASKINLASTSSKTSCMVPYNRLVKKRIENYHALISSIEQNSKKLVAKRSEFLDLL